jgi:hypothetical protein
MRLQDDRRTECNGRPDLVGDQIQRIVERGDRHDDPAGSSHEPSQPAFKTRPAVQCESLANGPINQSRTRLQCANAAGNLPPRLANRLDPFAPKPLSVVLGIRLDLRCCAREQVAARVAGQPGKLRPCMTRGTIACCASAPSAHAAIATTEPLSTSMTGTVSVPLCHEQPTQAWRCGVSARFFTACSTAGSRSARCCCRKGPRQRQPPASVEVAIAVRPRPRRRMART